MEWNGQKLQSKTRIRHVETRDDEKSTNQIEVLLEMELPHGLTKDEAILHIKTHGMQVWVCFAWAALTLIF